MATLYDETGAVVATGLMVLHESRLTQRRTDVVHDLMLGGLPYVVPKTPSGLAGNLELLCPTPEIADAVYAAHMGGPLRIDDWKRQNLLPDPRMTATPWSQAGSTGTFSHGTQFGPHGRGYFRYTLDTNTTSSPMVISLSDNGVDGIPCIAGEYLTMSSYWRASPAVEQVQRYDLSWYDAAGVALGTENGPDEFPGTLDPVTWLRVSQAFQAPAGAAYVFPKIVWSGTYLAGSALDVADALLERGTELRPWFDGGTPDTALLVNEWSGVENASVSTQYERPALNLTYIPVGGCGFPVKGSANYWRVSVPGIQEVA